MKPLALALMLMTAGPVWADDISELIKKLDAENFREREQAAKKLEALGPKAIPALIEAAGSGTLETEVRSVEILKSLAESKDRETAAQARSALEKLSESENAATARRAKNALNPPRSEPESIRRRPRPVALPPARPAPVPANGDRPRIRRANHNGVKGIEVEQGDRKVKLFEDAKNGIRVEITEKKNGKEETKTYEAKTEDELKKDHPEAHAEFVKYARLVRVMFGQRPAPANPPDKDVRLVAATRLLLSIRHHLRTMTKDGSIERGSKESREALEKEIIEMKNMLADLEKKLQETEEKANPKPAETEEKPEPAEN